MGKINIKGGDVYRASGILSSLNLQKADREIVISIYKNAAELKVLKKSLEDKAKEAKESVFSKIDEQRLTKVAKLREEYNFKDTSQERKIDILNEIYLYKDVLDAESALNEIYTRMEREDEYEVNIEKIDFNKFLDNLTDERIKEAEKSLREWLGIKDLSGKTFFSLHIFLASGRLEMSYFFRHKFIPSIRLS